MGNFKKHKNAIRPKYVIHARDLSIDLGINTKVMGIVNITPDSFSKDGCLLKDKDATKFAVNLAKKQIRNGADIVDIGGESSRPGSKKISSKQEIDRIIPAIRSLSKNISVPISVDTYKPLVAKHALDAGANIINNIKGIQAEKSLLKMVKNYGAAIVLMHMKGTPRTMQRSVSYGDLIKEIFVSLKNSIENCLEIGIKSDRIIIDPGIGFGKTVVNNLEIIDRLNDFSELRQPILIGTSRKSFIGNVLKREVQDRTFGTAASVSTCIVRGAHIVRVHDVKAMKDVTLLTDAIVNNSY